MNGRRCRLNINLCVSCGRRRIAAVTHEVPRMLTKGRAYFVDAGERLRLDCQFFMETFNLFDNPVVWIKTQLDERTQMNMMGNLVEPFNLFDNPVVWIKTQLDERTQMNMMGNLVEPFESTRRFRVTFEARRPTFTLGLLIEGNTWQHCWLENASLEVAWTSVARRTRWRNKSSAVAEKRRYASVRLFIICS